MAWLIKIDRYFKSLKKSLEFKGLFLNPDKIIPGNWELLEYYTEPENKLKHYDEGTLKAENRFIKIAFMRDGNLEINTNCSLSFFSNATNWRRKRNYLYISGPGQSGKATELQFAIKHDQLRLLHKNSGGRIEFFGMFKKNK